MADPITLNGLGRVVNSFGKGSVVGGGFVAALAAAAALAVLFFIAGAYFLTVIRLTTSVSKAGLALYLAIAKWTGVAVGGGLTIGFIGFMIRMVAEKCCAEPNKLNHVPR